MGVLIPYTAALNSGTGTLTVYRYVDGNFETADSISAFSGNTTNIGFNFVDVKAADEYTLYLVVGYQWQPTTSKTYLKIYKYTDNDGLILKASDEIGSMLDLVFGRWNPASFDFAFTTGSNIYVYNFNPENETITSKTSISYSSSKYLNWSSDGTRVVTSSPSSSVKSFAWDGENLTQKCSVTIESSSSCYYPHFVPGSNTDIIFYRSNTAIPPAYSLQRYTLNEQSGNSWTQQYYIMGNESMAWRRFLYLSLSNEFVYLILWNNDSYQHLSSSGNNVEVYTYDNAGFSFVNRFMGSWGTIGEGFGVISSYNDIAICSHLPQKRRTFLVGGFSSGRTILTTGTYGEENESNGDHPYSAKIHYTSSFGGLKNIVPIYNIDYKEQLSISAVAYNDEIFVGALASTTPAYVFRGIPDDDDSWTKYTLQSGNAKVRIHHNLAGAVFASAWDGVAGKVYIWDEDNEDWDDVGLSVSFEIFSVCGSATNNLWLTGNNRIYYWDGNNITEQKSVTTNYWWLNYWDNNLILCSSGDYPIYRWNGSSWNTVSGINTENNISNTSTHNGTVWWCAGHKSSYPRALNIYRSTDGGQNWTKYAITSVFYFRDHPNTPSWKISVIYAVDADNCLFAYLGGYFNYNRVSNTVTPIYMVPQCMVFSADGTLLGEINTTTGYVGQYSLSSWAPLGRISTPEIAYVSPNQAKAGTRKTVTIGGSEFQEGAELTLIRETTEIMATNVTVASDETIVCTFTIPRSAPIGSYNLHIVNPDTGNTTAEDVFTVLDPPPPLPPTAGNTILGGEQFTIGGPQR